MCLMPSLHSFVFVLLCPVLCRLIGKKNRSRNKDIDVEQKLLENRIKLRKKIRDDFESEPILNDDGSEIKSCCEQWCNDDLF